MPHPPPAEIADLAFLSDCHTAALVDRGGTVCWWCPPRFDAGSVFGCLLGAEAGHWSLRPVEPHEVTRAYEPGTLVLRTTFTTASGKVDLLDALALTSGARGEEHGLESPQTLLRRVEGIEGEVELETVFAPRMEYGLTIPHTREIDGGVETWGGPVRLTLRTPFSLTAEIGGARGRVTVRPGERVLLAASYTEARADASTPPEVSIDETLAGWQAWSEAHAGYDGPYADLVERSALVVQGLTFRPTGAVVAAATTSLPEQVGGELNFDYRFAWLRDLSLTVRALWISTCADEAARLFGWIADAAGHLDGGRVQIVYRVEGERVMAEQALDHLPGWADSAPVRVGNGAWDQRQLDVYGEVVDAAFQLRETLGELDTQDRDLLVGLADRAAAEWMEPDSGLWEARDRERHYLSSKVLCWVAVDRAIQLADQLEASDRVPVWSAARDDIRAAIEERGWCAEREAYGGAFDSDHLDASVLVMPLVGFCEAADERMRSTIEVIERELGPDGHLHRWEGEPHGFLICSFWLVECLALCGEHDRAEEWFERTAATANDLGLMAEMYDAEENALIGNFPQAFSHVGLINAAQRLSEAEGGA